MTFEPKRNDFINIMDHGFQEPEPNPKDYVFLGATKIPDEIIKPGGQWINNLVEKEYQRKYGVETMGCTGFGTLNANEIIDKFKYKVEHNWSDRAINILANNTPRGNNPNNPAEALRKIGITLEKSLPFDNSIKNWSDFHQPKPLPQHLLAECARWKDTYEFMHEWVNASSQNLMAALDRGPLGISVVAWKYRNGKYYKNREDRDNHWCVLVGYEKDVCWYAFDTYDQFVKKLEWNYNFKYAKKYYLKKLKEADDFPLPNGDIMPLQTIQFISDKPIYIQSLKDPKRIIHVNDSRNKDSWEDYMNVFIAEGLVTPKPKKINPALKPNYVILGEEINTDHVQPDITTSPFGNLFKWFIGLFKK